MKFKRSIKYNYRYFGKLYTFDKFGNLVEVSNDFTILFSIIKPKYGEIYNSEIIARCKYAIIENYPSVSELVMYDNNLIVIDYRNIELLDIVCKVDVRYDEDHALDVSDKTSIKEIPLQSNITVTVDCNHTNDAYDLIKKSISELSGVDKENIRLLNSNGEAI